jgi:hypothetical protein
MDVHQEAPSNSDTAEEQETDQLDYETGERQLLQEICNEMTKHE